MVNILSSQLLTKNFYLNCNNAVQIAVYKECITWKQFFIWESTIFWVLELSVRLHYFENINFLIILSSICNFHRRTKFLKLGSSKNYELRLENKTLSAFMWLTQFKITLKRSLTLSLPHGYICVSWEVSNHPVR